MIWSFARLLFRCQQVPPPRSIAWRMSSAQSKIVDNVSRKTRGTCPCIRSGFMQGHRPMHQLGALSNSRLTERICSRLVFEKGWSKNLFRASGWPRPRQVSKIFFPRQKTFCVRPGRQATLQTSELPLLRPLFCRTHAGIFPMSARHGQDCVTKVPWLPLQLSIFNITFVVSSSVL